MKGYRLQNKEGVGPIQYTNDCIDKGSVSEEELDGVRFKSK